MPRLVVAEPDHAAHARDQNASDRDQISSDRDQTSSDQDQTVSDRDQTSSDTDQRSSNEDQAAADDDLDHGSDRATYDRTTRARAVASGDRQATSQQRDEAGDARAGTASHRDRAAARRDRGADSRDAAAWDRDQETDAGSSWQDILLRAQHDRERAAVDRERAADDRAQAAADRHVAALEREEALRIRREASRLLEQATTDQLTGARTRFLGLDEALRELERGRRTGEQVVLAFVDVDGLKQLNDSAGHLAGDAFLALVGETIRASMRPYDVLVRYGGDEFVCAMSNIDASETRARFSKISEALSAVDPKFSIGVGIAQAKPAESLQAVIARADADLLAGRSHGQRSEGTDQAVE
jgi:diguanylate cyclase (GGDEF)-like protein